MNTHLALVQQLASNDELIGHIQQTADVIIQSLKAGGCLHTCGNGGSAADAQHIAGELSGRFLLDRDPLHAEALHVNSSFVTAVANDYDFDEIFARALQAKGRAGDVLLAISTSGNSENVYRAVMKAKELDITVIALTGRSGGKIADHAQLVLAIPHDDVPRIQEMHILIGHIICEIVELALA